MTFTMARVSTSNRNVMEKIMEGKKFLNFTTNFVSGILKYSGSPGTSPFDKSPPSHLSLQLTRSDSSKHSPSTPPPIAPKPKSPKLQWKQFSIDPSINGNPSLNIQTTRQQDAAARKPISEQQTFSFNQPIRGQITEIQPITEPELSDVMKLSSKSKGHQQSHSDVISSDQLDMSSALAELDAAVNSLQDLAIGNNTKSETIRKAGMKNYVKTSLNTSRTIS